ncbi:MAG: ABC transporter substrate-binding protein [Armatimonas sp.]
MPAPATRRSFLQASAGTLLLASLAGCTPRNSGTTNQASSTAAGATALGVLRYPLAEEPPTLDPHVCQSAGTNEVLLNIFDTLYLYDEKNELQPLLAASLPKVSADGKTYTIPLRPDVRFHNGILLTAEDVRYSLIRMLDPALGSSNGLYALGDVRGANTFATGKSKTLDSIRILDPHTIQIELEGPRTSFLEKLIISIVSQAVTEAAPKNEHGVPILDKTCAIGTGPFRLMEYTRQSRLVLAAFPDYWNGAPLLKQLEVAIVLDNKTRRNLYEVGQLDYIREDSVNLNTDRADPARKKELLIQDMVGSLYLTLQCKNCPPLRDARVRQALMYATDQEVIVQAALYDSVKPAHGLLAPGTPGSLLPEQEKPLYNVEKARALLAEAGYTASHPLPPLTLTYVEKDSEAARVVQIIAEQWAKAGVKLWLQESEWGTMLKRMNDKKFEIMYNGWVPGLDPIGTLVPLLTSDSAFNVSGYTNPRYDALCAAADRERNPEKRAALCREATLLALHDAPLIPLSFNRSNYLVRPPVHDLRLCMMGVLPHTITRVG